MDVRSFGLALQSAFKHFLRRHILTAIQFNDATIVKRVGIARKNALCAKPGLGDRKIRACARRDLRNLEIFVQKSAKLITRFTKTASRELFVSSLESL